MRRAEDRDYFKHTTWFSSDPPNTWKNAVFREGAETSLKKTAKERDLVQTRHKTYNEFPNSVKVKVKVKVKLKQSRYRPGMAQRVPGS
jgi:hypothetical protein